MPKFRMNMPASPTVHTKRYSAFKGVDFSSDPTQVDDSRSPRAVNVYPDATGCPQKRPGWKRIANNTDGAPVRGIHRFKTVEKKDDNTVKVPTMDRIIIHTGDSLYVREGTAEGDLGTVIMSGLEGKKSTGFMHDDKLYILTGKEFVVISTGKNEQWTLKASMADSLDGAYIPLTRIDISPTYVVRGSEKRPDESGTTLGCDLLNCATAYRRNRVNFDKSKLSGTVNNSTTPNCMKVLLEGKIPAETALEKVKLVTARGKSLLCNYEHKSDNVYIGDGKICELEAGRDVMYIDGPRLKEWLGNDDSTYFEIFYPITPPEDKPDLYTRISKCHVADWYNSRLFVSGNPDYPNADFYSQVGEPTYFIDINYTEIGSQDSRIMGYLGVGNQQAVLKSDSIQLQDSSVYLRRAEWDSEEGYYYPLQSGIVGTGAVSEKAITTFVDDAVFLTKEGVMGLITENITGERVLAQRSTRINKRLLAEPNLDKAVMQVWNGFLLIAVNGHVYLADSRQKTYARNSTNTYEYEWYYWENIGIHWIPYTYQKDNVTCLLTIDDALIFGTENGNLCVLGKNANNRVTDFPQGNENINAIGTAIVAEWSTKLDDDGSFTLQKNLCRRGCGIFLKGVKNGKVKILVRTDKEFDEDMQLVDKDLSARSYSELNFEEFDFENLSFKNKTCMVAAPNKRVKKYAALQIICRSDNRTSDFGLMGIEKRYTIGRFEK